MKFKELLIENTVVEAFSIETNDGAEKKKQSFKGKIGEMISWTSGQKGFSHLGYWEDEDDINFEIYFENPRQALQIVRKLNDKYGYYLREVGNNKRIIEIMLNDAGRKEQGI
jgi:hypothetical protein